jgi:hypothetical protein
VADIIIKTKSGEVIPQISPEAFGLAVQSMEQLDAQMGELEVKAKALPKIFETKAQRDEAASLVSQKKSIVKLSESTMTPYTELIKKVKTFVDTQRNIVKNHGEIVSSLVEPAIVEWDEREKRAAEAEQRRLQAEREAKLKRENEEKAEKDRLAAEERKKERVDQIREDLRNKKITKRQAEKFLREAGAGEEADKARIAAEREEADAKAAEDAAKIKVKPKTTPTAGLVRRTNYAAECTDEDALLWAFVAECNKLGRFGDLRSFVMANNQKIGEKARDVKDDDEMMKLYPFVKATHTHSM